MWIKKLKEVKDRVGDDNARVSVRRLNQESGVKKEMYHVGQFTPSTQSTLCRPSD